MLKTYTLLTNFSERQTLLEPQKVALNAKSCSKVAELNRDRPIRLLRLVCLHRPLILPYITYPANTLVPGPTENPSRPTIGRVFWRWTRILRPALIAWIPKYSYCCTFSIKESPESAPASLTFKTLWPSFPEKSENQSLNPSTHWSVRPSVRT